MKATISAALLLSTAIAFAQPRPGATELAQTFHPYGQMPDGSWAAIETMTLTEEREATNPDTGEVYTNTVQATILHAYPITGTFTTGALDPDNSYVVFSVNGQCPHPDMPYVTCHVPGDFHMVAADEDGRYNAVACASRAADGGCAELGDEFFIGMTMDDVDELPPPPERSFVAVGNIPKCFPYDCDPHVGLWQFATVPQVFVIQGSVEMRQVFDGGEVGPIVDGDIAPAHANDLGSGWVNDDSPAWTHVGTTCPGVGRWQWRVKVVALVEDGTAQETQFSHWRDMMIASCNWAPLNPADLDADGDNDIFDLGIFRQWFSP